MQRLNLMVTLPDDWGRALLSKKWNIPRAEQTVPKFFNPECRRSKGPVSDPDQVIEDVYQSVVNWQDVFWQYEVPEEDIQRLEIGIMQRLKKD